jgi:hypothetical protein
VYQDLWSQLAQERAADLRAAGERQRLRHAAARPSSRSPRERLGKRLISWGSKLVDEPVRFEQRAS